jgi:CSLREA domain-containing protein
MSRASVLRRLLSVVAVPAMLTAVAFAPGQAAARQPAVAVELLAPPKAAVGELVAVRVRVHGVPALAGFELVATLAPDAGQIEDADASNPSAATRRDDMSLAALPGYAVLAAYSPSGASARAATVDLGTLYVRLTKPGVVQLRTGAGQFVDGNGAVIGTGGDATATIRVGQGGSDVPAPAMPWSLRDGGATPSAWPAAPIELQLDWQTTRIAKAPCAGTSAQAADGCVSIADVQRLASTPQELSVATAPTTQAATAAGTTFVVNSTGDQWDAKVGDAICRTSAGTCTLRAAIQEANAQAGANTINFAIPGTGPFLIQLGSRLPALADKSGPTTINGYSQSGASPNTTAAPGPDNAVIQIQIAGNGPDGFEGVVITSGGNTVKGLSLYNLGREIWIYRTGVGAVGNIIQGNFVGTNAAGTFVAPTLGTIGHGMHIEQDSPNTLIGGTNPADRNVVSGSARTGIGMWHGATDNTRIYGNIIGLSPHGDRAVPNRKHGVDMNFGVSGTIVGGTAAGQVNVISGNDDDGVEISHTTGTANNTVTGNNIGTSLDGNSAPAYTANKNTGVYIEDAATGNIVQNNIIAHNAKGGVTIINGPNGIPSGNVVRNNRIGMTKNGTIAGNGNQGVQVDGMLSVIGPGNIITGNTGAGIVSTLAGAVRNTFTRNSIYGNSGLSIDLAPRGKVNPNDAGDTDSGPNTLLNFPVITAAHSTSVTGTVCAGCTVEVYQTGLSGATPTGNGPARTFLGSVVADGSGHFTLGGLALAVGSWVSATATDTSGDTSEMAFNARVS